MKTDARYYTKERWVRQVVIMLLIGMVFISGCTEVEDSTTIPKQNTTSESS